MSDCLPCDLEEADAARIVYRDDTWSCEIADGYDVPGWFILRLRRHAEGWAGPTADELAAFGPLSQRLAAAIQDATGAPTVYFMSFGENYPHFHFLVIARPADLPAELEVPRSSRNALITATSTHPSLSAPRCAPRSLSPNSDHPTTSATPSTRKDDDVHSTHPLRERLRRSIRLHLQRPHQHR